MNMIIPRPPSSIGRMGVETVRKNYLELAGQMNDILQSNIVRCPRCGEFLPREKFYTYNAYNTGYYPVCKECLLDMATDYDAKAKRYIDNRAKTIDVCHLLDVPFMEDLYQQCLEKVKNNDFGRGKTAYSQMMAAVVCLPHYQQMHFKDSRFADGTDFSYEFETNRKARREIKKLFGAGFTEADYLYLQDQYDDFRARTQVDSKSQEVYVTQICLSLLDIDKDRKAGKDVTKKVQSLDALMASAKLQPKQNVNNAATDSLSFGQLVEKWEQEKPIPEPDPEFKDVNGIGKLIRVYFAGHLSKALGLKNSYSKEYEDEISKYTVLPPQLGENGSSDTYQQIFGNDES